MNKSKPKKPGTSGRLHRNETGDWVWSDDEEGDSDDETIQKKPPKKVNQVFVYKKAFVLWFLIKN